MTASTVAALLTILGFSLYDTIIVFDRIRENMPRMPRPPSRRSSTARCPRCSTRSLATSLSTLLPMLALLLFGGETLKDFAFALLVGIASGAYSSIFIASPGAHALEGARADLHASGAADRGENGGVVPPTRRPTGRRRARPRQAPPESKSLAAPERRAGLRSAEFEEMSPSSASTRTAPTGAPRRQARIASRAEREAGGGAATTERPGPDGGNGPAGRRRQRRDQAQAAEEQEAGQTREDALMGMLAWVMMGLAIWHFTIFLPDRFWGGIVGACWRR